MGSHLVEMCNICKSFPGVKALDNINFTLESGEVHVLFGENGAGKSTLISILSGVYPPTSGELKILGKPVHLNSTQDANEQGVGTVFQEFSLVPTLSVAENVYLGSEIKRGWFLDRADMIRKTQELFDRLGFEINAKDKVNSLSRAEQQMVEIAKAFHADAKILILDEPTASLTDKETSKLFEFILEAKARGVGVIYISHRIQEFAAITDRITVLRDGQYIGTVDAGDGISEKKLVEMMTGRTIDEIYPQIQQQDGEVILSLEHLNADGVKDVSLQVRQGEVLGVAGLVGSGKSRIWRTIMGLQPAYSGKVEFKGQLITRADTRELLKRGMFYLPPDRKSEGLQLTATARNNIQLSLLGRPEVTSRMGFVQPRKSHQLSSEIGQQVDLGKGYLDRTAAKLSGGNQQKILFGKGFCEDRDLYIFDEPTVGVDMGTRAALYQLIKQLAEAGKAVVIISSDLPEAMNLSHRLLVFANERIAAELSGAEKTEETILNYFFTDASEKGVSEWREAV